MSKKKEDFSVIPAKAGIQDIFGKNFAVLKSHFNPLF